MKSLGTYPVSRNDTLMRGDVIQVLDVVMKKENAKHRS